MICLDTNHHTNGCNIFVSIDQLKLTKRVADKDVMRAKKIATGLIFQIFQHALG